MKRVILIDTTTATSLFLDNDKEREILRQDLVSANALMLAALQIFETDELGGATLVYLPDNDHQSH